MRGEMCENSKNKNKHIQPLRRCRAQLLVQLWGAVSWHHPASICSTEEPVLKGNERLSDWSLHPWPDAPMNLLRLHGWLIYSGSPECSEMVVLIQVKNKKSQIKSNCCCTPPRPTRQCRAAHRHKQSKHRCCSPTRNQERWEIVWPCQCHHRAFSSTTVFNRLLRLTVYVYSDWLAFAQKHVYILCSQSGSAPLPRCTQGE